MKKLISKCQIILVLIVSLILMSCSQSGDTIETANKAIVSRLIEEGINNQNLEIFDEILSPNYVRYSQSMSADLGEITGIDTYKGFLEEGFVSFPDYKEEIVQMIAEDDKVFIITKGTALNSGPMGDIPPTNKEFTIYNYGLFRIENNKVVEMWVSWDNVSMLKQLGLYMN